MTQFNVLVVDDEVGMREGVKRILKEYQINLDDFNDNISFKMNTAQNGAEAFKILKNGSIDILLLDHKLPDIQGLEILTKINKENYNILTIMITAYASIEVAINATKNGAFDFLAKPFTPDELKNTIKKTAEHIFLTKKAQRLEEEKRKVRFQFISVLAHELKSPLSAVENYLYIIKDKMYGNDMEKHDHMINRSIYRIEGMKKLIIDLLDLTGIESGEKKRTFEELNLYRISKDIIETIKLDAEKRGININFECKKNTEIIADKVEIEIIINNLLTNAVKYNKDNGTVNLTIVQKKGSIEIICSDSGIGMNENELKNLFKEFTRIKNEKTKDIAGSGLGLSILKKIVNLYHGNIKVESNPGHGTKFNLLLKGEKE